jgi:dephospho-CoA kinase
MTTIIGLTGGIASGKSTVSNIFKKRGFSIIDADIAAKIVVEPGEGAYDEIVEFFGKDILLEDGKINRKKLGSIIFHEEEKREALNRIVHPAVRERMNDWKEKAIADGKNTIIYDIPLLYESKLTNLVEKVVVVYVNEAFQLQRLIERNDLTKMEAKARIKSQLPLEDKKKWADALVDNNGTMDQTEKQIDDIIGKWNLIP